MLNSVKMVHKFHPYHLYTNGLGLHVDNILKNQEKEFTKIENKKPNFLIRTDYAEKNKTCICVDV